MKNNLLSKALTIVHLYFYKNCFATAPVFRFAFTAAMTDLAFARKAEILGFSSANMMRDANAANVGSKQAHQYNCDKSFHSPNSKTRKVVII